MAAEEQKDSGATAKKWDQWARVVRQMLLLVDRLCTACRRGLHLPNRMLLSSRVCDPHRPPDMLVLPAECRIR